jgi:NAD(P)H-dependent flavin oxidoreductase YrpB (nitropropane dioxygenase family)
VLRTPVTELLGIEHPILQAPMASAATPALAAAVSEAGGLGALGSAMLPVDELRRQTAELRELTGGPFQLNFFCHEPPEVSGDIADRAREYFAPLYDELGLGDPPQPSAPAVEFDEARLDTLLELRPPVVSFHFGLPARALRNRMTQDLSGVLPYPAQLSLTAPLFASEGAEFQAMWSGQAAALATEAPAAEVVAAIAAGAEAIVRR